MKEGGSLLLSWFKRADTSRGTSPPIQYPQGPPTFLPTPMLAHLSNLYDALKTHMHSKHKFGHANPTTGFFSYYKGLLP